MASPPGRNRPGVRATLALPAPTAERFPGGTSPTMLACRWKPLVLYSWLDLETG
jgi:hypothetical protein